MGRSRRKFTRPLGERRYRRIFILASEGKETEQQYFHSFNSDDAEVRVKCIPSRGGRSPRQVLACMKRYVEVNALQAQDAAWLVVDVDHWTVEQLSELHRWSLLKSNYGLAVSYPKFEYWLLLHFEDGSGVTSPANCIRRLRRHLPYFDKGHVEIGKLRLGIPEAIQRAKQKDTPPCTDWPRRNGSTVYRLVEQLMNAGKE